MRTSLAGLDKAAQNPGIHRPAFSVNGLAPRTLVRLIPAWRQQDCEDRASAITFVEQIALMPAYAYLLYEAADW